MEMTVVLRTREGTRAVQGGEFRALAALVPLSLDVETFDEFVTGLAGVGEEAAAWRGESVAVDGFEVVRTASAWCVVDFVGRTIVARNWNIPRLGCYVTDDEVDLPENEQHPVWLHIPADWELSHDRAGWEEWLEGRRATAVPRRRLDARAVLLGPPLIEFLAERLRPFAQLATARDESAIYVRTKSIHAEWMMTPRDDLHGKTPREVLLEQRDFLDREIELRVGRWSSDRRPPPPLPRDWPAYRFAGFTTMEIVLYFDMIRALLAHAWTSLEDAPQLSSAELVALLTEYQDRWLNSLEDDDPDLNLTRAQMMESARQRMPLTGHFHGDDDCEMCRELAENSMGPMFIMYDGHQLELEDEFAFSLAYDRKEWEEQQASWNS